MSIHPTQSNKEVRYILEAIKQLAENHREWAKEYEVDLIKGRIKPKENDTTTAMEAMIDDCLERGFGALSQTL
ncbi:MAG: hypothetical protein U5L96_07435 [Owenweeksia sp.]|nr:hypothetical protein [Owenweeksia sp.]